MAIDIFNPPVSVIPKDLRGRSVLIYGSNRLAKTLVGVSLPKPFYVGFESGLGSRANIPFVNIQKWSDFLSIVKQLTSPSTVEKAQETYQTIVVDTIDAAARFCEEYTCGKYGVDTIASGNRGFGLWKEFTNELWGPIQKLCSSSYTVYFVGHDGTREFKDENGEEYTKIYPRGEKRIVDIVVDMVDIIGFVQANGLDENGTEIKSSAYFTNTKKYLAGTRYDFFPNYLPVFSAEGLQDAMRVAVEGQEEHDKAKAVEPSVSKKVGLASRRSLDELQGDIRKIAMALAEQGKGDAYKQVVENYLGIGGSVKEATAAQTQQLELILDDIKDLM